MRLDQIEQKVSTLPVRPVLSPGREMERMFRGAVSADAGRHRLRDHVSH